jgi:hypothetical protein
VIAVGVADPRELELPDVGFVELEDPETGDTLLVDTGDPEFRDAFRKEARHEYKRIQTIFQKVSVDYVRIIIAPETKDTVAPLVEYFRRRSREVRRAG